MCGCDAAGYFAWLLHPRKEKEIKAACPMLKDHSVAVVFYSDESIQYEYPDARLTLGTRIGEALRQNVEHCTVISPMTVARYQDEDLRWDQQDKRKIAKDLGADYLLFISLTVYNTRVPGALDAYQGIIAAEVQMYDAHAKDDTPIWEPDDAIEVTFPDVPRYSARIEPIIRAKTEQQFTDILVKNFYDHKVPAIKEGE